MTKAVVRKLTDLVPDARNANKGTERGLRMLDDSLREDGAGRGILLDKNNQVIAGNKTLERAVDQGYEEIIIVPTDGKQLVATQRVDVDIDTPQGRRMALRDNRVAQVDLDWDADVLAGLAGEGVDLAAFWNEDELAELLATPAETGDGELTPEVARQTLAERFIIPPFSVLDARQGYWQSRKRAWIALGIQSELGRGESLRGESAQALQFDDYRKGKGSYSKTANGRGLARTDGQDLANGENPKFFQNGKPASATYHAAATPSDEVSRKILAANPNRYGEKNMAFDGGAMPSNAIVPTNGTSIFDPVLCELAYRWFMPIGGHILDPFAGGSVRGIVAAHLGYQYTGVDLRPEQIEVNAAQAAIIVPQSNPRWIVGDSRDLQSLAPGEYDFVFSCPPYFDLEIYSDDPHDLSNAGDYDKFIDDYRAIIRQAVAMLKPNRFACFIVGDIRDKRGFYRNFPAATITAFQDAGAILYNEAVLVTAAGSLPIRVRGQFEGYRKLGKTHQNVLVFFKGDPKTINTFGKIQVDWSVIESELDAESGSEVL